MLHKPKHQEPQCKVSERIDCQTMKSSLQKLKYDIHSKLPLESYQIHFGMIPVATWYEFISYFSFCSVKWN